jgi:hypothetical protein
MFIVSPIFIQNLFMLTLSFKFFRVAIKGSFTKPLEASVEEHHADIYGIERTTQLYPGH